MKGENHVPAIGKKEALPQERSYTPDGVVLPPDGGWGWVIVVAAFVISMIVDGIIFSFGVILPELINSFNEGTSKTAMVGSLLAGFYLFVGPLVSALANRFGCRSVGIAGSLIACVSFMLGMFANSIDYLCVTIGIMGGVGFGLIYLPAIVSVGFYFDKRRAFATGIAVCGSGVGTFLFAPLSSYLIGEYGWRGTLLIQSAIILNCAAMAGFLRPLVANSSGNLSGASSCSSFNRCQRSYDKETNSSYNWDSTDKLTNSGVVRQNVRKVTLPQLIVTNENFTQIPIAYDQQDARNVLQRQHSHSLPSLEDSTNRPFYRMDVMYTGSLSRIPQYAPSISRSDMRQYHASMTSIPSRRSMSTCRSERVLAKMGCSVAIRSTISTMLDLSLLTSVTFVILCLAGFLTMMGFFIPFVYLVEYALSVGVQKNEAAILLSVIGITNTAGRILSGWLSDRPQINALFINNIALIMGGLATVVMPFVTQYEILIVCSAVFGISIACFASLRSIILVDLLGLEKLTNSYGLLLLFQGVASIVGSPLAGLCFDKTRTYQASFCIAGILIAVSGIMGFPLPAISRWERRRAGLINDDPVKEKLQATSNSVTAAA